MTIPGKITSWLQKRVHRYPILLRILIINIFVVSFGALIGMWAMRQISILSRAEALLVLLGGGTFVSLVMNFWIIYTVSLPLHELREAVDEAHADQKALVESEMMRADPDIHRLVEAINLLLERLGNRARMLRALSERAISAQEEERKRIARTLHDDTIQSLSYLIIELEHLETSGLEDKQLTAVRLTKVRKLAVDILDDLRKNIWDLRPSILDDLGLCPAIRWLARMQLGEAGMTVEFELPPENLRLQAHLETMLFRVTQEALNNVLRHSQARNVVIHMHHQKERVCLEIEDDGMGFDTPTTQDAVSSKRLGLLGIQERVSLVNGSLKVISKPGQGTRIHICVPLEENELAPEIINETTDLEVDVKT